MRRRTINDVRAMATSAFFGLIMLATWVADAFLNTCHGS
jgi:hypothetical protein